MNVERVFRILWGPTLENALDFAFPVVGEAPTFSRQPRTNSAMIPTGAAALAVITGRHYRLKLNAKYFGGPQNFGATGLQAFIDWAADANQFTLMPNIALPTLTVTGCYLEGPFTQLSPSQEKDGTQTLPLTILHPTVDLGIAWRGLFFEYVAGSSLTDPARLTYLRGSIGYEITPQGYLLSRPADVICDGHYPGGIGGAGVQTTHISAAVANDIGTPEDLTNATSWPVKNECTITPNGAKAPDQNVTADLIVESANPAAIHTCNSAAITIVAGDVQTAIAFVRDGGRTNGILWFNDAPTGAGGNRFGVAFNLLTGTITGTQTLGTGTLQASAIVPMAGGWYMLYIRGTLGGAVTTSYLALRLGDNGGTGTFTYTGDGVSGMYFWGATAVHGSGCPPVSMYAPTVRSADTLTAPWLQVPQAMWVLIEFVEGGAAPANATNGPFNIGTPGVTPFTRYDTFANPGYRFSHQTPTVAFSSTPSGVPVVGDTVALLGIIYPDGSVEGHQVINAGAETVGARSGAIPFSAAWSNNILQLIHDGFTGGLARLRIGPFVATGPAAVTTIAQARYV